MRRQLLAINPLVPSQWDASDFGDCVGGVFFAPLSVTTIGRADDTDAQKAAKEIADARERANAAADAYFASESRIDQLDLQQNQLQSEISAARGRRQGAAVVGRERGHRSVHPVG